MFPNEKKVANNPGFDVFSKEKELIPQDLIYQQNFLQPSHQPR